MKDKYLISAPSLKYANQVARENNLSLSQWSYIPYEENARSRKLPGRRVSDEKYLIGYFSPAEKGLLISK
jgi:hypothetical protein